MKRMKQSIYLGGEYQIISSDMYFFEKYNDALPKFILDDTAEKVLGKNWWTNKELDQSQVITSFKSRMKIKEMDLEKIDDLIVYGKIKENGSPFLFPEIILFREIIFNQTLDEFDHQLKTNQIKIKNLLI